MVKRDVSKKNLIIAIILTLLLFSMGILIGLLVSERRISHLEQISKDQRLDYESLQLQFLMITDSNKEKSCPVLIESLEQNIKRLISTGEKIEKYSEDLNLNSKEFETLKRDYTLTQLNFWFLVKKSREICEKDVVPIIYFYSNDKDCAYCSTQSRILTYVKGKFKERTMIFSFDGSFEQEALIPILKKVYNVQEYPSLIIDEKTYSGLITTNELEEIICSKLKEHEEC